jgi:hypothetical protein
VTLACPEYKNDLVACLKSRFHLLFRKTVLKYKEANSIGLMKTTTLLFVYLLY